MPPVLSMEGDDMLPVRDAHSQAKIPRTAAAARLADGDAAGQQAAQQRRMVARWEREELEDKYLTLMEQNLQLKKYGRKQDEKIKKMATKLIRLAQDKKRSEKAEGGPRKVRDFEMEERLEEQKAEVAELQRKNHQLVEKLQVMKQQMATGKRPTPQVYDYVQSRINTGKPKPPGIDSSRSLRGNRRVMGPHDHHEPASRTMGQPQRYGHSLLEDARVENRRMHNQMEHLHEQINIYEQDIEILREQMRIKEEEYKEDLLKIKQTVTAGERAQLQENIDLVRLQRELREKSTRLAALQAQFEDSQANMGAVKGSHDTALREVESLTRQLQEEQNRVMELQAEVRASGTTRRQVYELQEQVKDLSKEANILKEANEKLTSSAFDLEREREWRQKEHGLKVQIAQLEATLKADLGEKGTVLDKLAVEKDGYDRLEAEHRTLQVQYYQVKEQLDDASEKMKFFTKESAIDFSELEEALILVRKRKQKHETEQLEFLHRVEDERDKDVEKAYRELQAEYAEAVSELEKARTMLITQHRINNDYRLEMESATRKLDEEKKEFDTRMMELSQLADIRAARIRKLESQLTDVAYGTRQYRMPPLDDDDVESIDETVQLERGQNVFEIHISKVNLSRDALQWLGDEEASTLCTVEFFEFETQHSSVIKGTKPQYDMTAQYVVTVDDFFLHYLQKDSASMELHQSFGTEYRTVAVCQLLFAKVIETSHGRIHGEAVLTGCQDGPVGLNFGTVEYWARLRVPMEQALRLYRERCKAAGYVMSNERAAVAATQALDEVAAARPQDNVNQLHVKLVKASGIKARRPDMQPSPYAMYKFFDFDDHDTTIVGSSNRPHFNDHQTFAVEMNTDLDRYLKAKHLDVYLFDDTDPDEQAYLGLAQVPLIPLAHDKAVRGEFALKTREGDANGSVNVELRWQYSYFGPRSGQGGAAEDPVRRALAAERDQMRTPPQQHGRGGPVTSTPVDKQLPERDSPLARPPTRKLPGTQKRPERHVTMRSEPEYEPERDSSGQRSRPGSVDSDLTPSADRTESSGESEGQIVEDELSRGAQPLQDDDVDDDSLTPSELEGPASVEPPPPRAAVRGPERRPAPRRRQVGIESLDEVRTSAELGSTGTQDYLNALASQDHEEGDPDRLIAEQLAQPPSRSSHSHDDDDDSDVTLEGEDDPPPMSLPLTSRHESDSEGVVTVTPTPYSMAENPDVVSVTISHLSLHEGADILSDPEVHSLFVEYRFLGLPAEELETPFCLPKPGPDKQIAFNFQKRFLVDYDNNYEKRQYLASMLLPSDPDKGRITFTVVSEPPPKDPGAGNCVDVGTASVSLPQAYREKRDLMGIDVPIYSVDDTSEEIGTLNVSLQCLAALNAVNTEMQMNTLRPR